MKKIFILILLFFTVLISYCQEIKSVKITDLEKIINESNTPLIINFWATWCIPCIEELPYFQEEVKKHNLSKSSLQSLKLLLVSMDFQEAFPKSISAFAAKRKIKSTIVWLDETNADIFCPKIDAKWSGAIPATLFINNETGYRKFYEEQISMQKLQEEIKALLEIN